MHGVEYPPLWYHAEWFYHLQRISFVLHLFNLPLSPNPSNVWFICCLHSFAFPECPINSEIIQCVAFSDWLLSLCLSLFFSLSPSSTPSPILPAYPSFCINFTLGTGFLYKLVPSSSIAPPPHSLWHVTLPPGSIHFSPIGFLMLSLEHVRHNPKSESLKLATSLTWDPLPLLILFRYLLKFQPHNEAFITIKLQLSIWFLWLFFSVALSLIWHIFYLFIVIPFLHPLEHQLHREPISSAPRIASGPHYSLNQ